MKLKYNTMQALLLLTASIILCYCLVNDIETLFENRPKFNVLDNVKSIFLKLKIRKQ